MARKEMKVTIHAEPHATKAGEYQFYMTDHKNQTVKGNTPLTFRKRDFDEMKCSDHHEVKFKLDQEPGMKLEFAQSLDDVLWVTMGKEGDPGFPACPTEKTAKNDVFFAERSSGNTLTVINTNPCEQNFSFTINLVDSTATGPQKLIPYDPPGSNQNGGTEIIC